MCRCASASSPVSWCRSTTISESLLLKVDALRELRPRQGFPIEIAVFCHGCDDNIRDQLGIPVFSGGVSHILSRSPFAHQDVHVFEFGIHYPLFDAVFALRSPASAIGVFHNITPIDLVDTAEGLAAVQRAQRQAANLGHVGTIVCDSEFNRDALADIGLAAARRR